MTTAPGAGPPTGSAAPGSRIWPVLRVLVVAACLRPALTAVGPVLGDIGADLRLGPGALGLLGALPLLCFGLASPLARPLAHRLGSDRAVALALVVVAAGTALRSAPVPAALWAGTLALGSAIAIGNVLVPAIVKRDVPQHVSLMSGVYAAVIGLSAAAASGLAQPLARLPGGWRTALGVWAALALAVLPLWWLTRHPDADRPGTASAARPRLRGSLLAWAVTAFMGLQGLTFYLLVTWLPSIETWRGVDAVTAGWHLAIYQAAGIVAGPLVSLIAQRGSDQRMICFASSVLLTVAVAGAAMQPGWLLLWVVLAGLSQGSTFALALALVALRAHDPTTTVALSGMAQSIGYLVAASGPGLAGILREGTGGWAVVLLVVAAIALVQAVIGLWAGADRQVSG